MLIEQAARKSRAKMQNRKARKAQAALNPVAFLLHVFAPLRET
jgi:hypothetical protein